MQGMLLLEKQALQYFLFNSNVFEITSSSSCGHKQLPEVRGILFSLKNIQERNCLHYSTLFEKTDQSQFHQQNFNTRCN